MSSSTESGPLERNRKASKRTLVPSHNHQSYLATLDPEPFAEKLATYTSEGIKKSNRFGVDPVLATIVHNAHVPYSPNSGDPDTPLQYPSQGPLTVYDFMKRYGVIDDTWDTKDPPRSLPPCSTLWNMADVQPITLMKAAEKASKQLRDWPKPPMCDGTSLGFLDQTMSLWERAPDLRIPSHTALDMFKYVMETEATACLEYIDNKAASIAGSDQQQSHQAMNKYFHALDVMTQPRQPGTPLRSKAFIETVVEKKFKQWENFADQREGDGHRTYPGFLFSLDPRYNHRNLQGSRSAMRVAWDTRQTTSADLTDRMEDIFDYVGAYERIGGMDAGGGQDNEDETLRLSRLAAGVDRTKEIKELFKEWPCTESDEPNDQ